jgi:hypothetical protein
MTTEEAIRFRVLEDRVSKLAAIIQILLEAIRVGTEKEIAPRLYDVIVEEFEQTPDVNGSGVSRRSSTN